MRALLQRCQWAKVEVGGEIIGVVDAGLMVLVGVQPEDDEAKVKRMAERILGYRVFSDENDKMNLNLKQIDGGLLLVPQFTLAADTNSGMRPSFSTAAPPEKGERLFNRLVEECRRLHDEVETGSFGADMQVSLCNDGPVTFLLEI